MVGLAALAIIGLYLILSNVRSTISGEQERLAQARMVKVKTVNLRPLNREGIAYHGHIQEVRDLIRFAGLYYATTPGGLVVLDERGQIAAHHTTLDGLPEYDLTALATFQEQLYIGTAGQGLVSYDGRTFRQHQFIQPKVGHVSALVTTDDRLLIGMLDGGLFEYDGNQFRHSMSAGDGIGPQRITAVWSRYPEIYVGTFAEGLWIWREGRWDQLTTKDGLPSNRVTALVEDPDGIVVGTDLGIVRLNQNQMTPMAELGNVTSLIRFQERTYAGLFTGQIVQLPESKTRRPIRVQMNPIALPDIATNIILTSENDGLWVLTSRGIYHTPSPGTEPIKRFDQVGLGFQPAASHVSALAIDWRGRLWIGYFDHGIDVVAPNEMKLITHIEGEVVREINYIHADPDGRRILAATSAGLVVIDELMKQQRYTERDGLISSSVAHVLPVPASIILPRPDDRPNQEQALVLPTGKGLSVYAENLFRSLNAFHGLASNHLYTSARVRDKVFVGTLNGLNELEGLRVVRTFQTSNSQLSHNWVSALAVVENTLYIGTYGGGVDALLPSGEMINFASLIGKFSVNPNAMHFDGERLHVGTLDQGVRILDVRQETWSRFTQGLGPNNVTAITSDAQAIYFGTDHGLMRIERHRL